MFHVQQIKKLWIHNILLYLFLFLLPIQTRLILNSDTAYIDYYFSSHLAFFLYLSDLVFVTALTSWFFFNYRQHLSRFWPMLAIFAWILLSLFHVERLDLGIYGFLKSTELLLIIIYLALILKNNENLKYTALMILYLSSILQALIGIYQFIFQKAVGLRFLGEYLPSVNVSGAATIRLGKDVFVRAYGTMPHPNVLSAFLILGLIIGLFYVSHETNRFKWLVSCGNVLLILGLAYTFSRSGWLAAIVGILSWLVYNLVTHKTKWLKYAIFILIVSCGTLFLRNSNLLVFRAEDTTNITQAIGYRQSFNQRALTIVSENNILTGLGVNQYIPATVKRFHVKPWQYQPPHNVFLYILVELGIIGILIYALLIRYIIRFTWNNWRNPEYFGLITILICFFVISLFDHYLITLQQGQLMLFSVLGFLLSYKE